MDIEELTIRQKVLIGVGLILLAVLGIYGIYFFFLRTPSAPPAAEIPEETTQPETRRPGLPTARPGTPGTPITPTTGTGTPSVTPSEETLDAPGAPLPSPIANGGLTTVTPLVQDIAMPSRADNGRDIAFYNKSDGKFYRTTSEGKTTPLSDQVFRDVDRVAWAPRAEKAILEFPDGANVLYDFNSERQATLPKHWTDFSFSGQGNAIAFKSIGLDPEDRWLAVANPDGSNVEAVEPLGENADKVTVNWSPNNAMIGTYTESRDAVRQELFFIGKHGENFRLAVLEGRDFVGQWTPKGDRMLYSVYSPQTDFKPSLWLVDAAPGATGENREHLELQTWADKCTITPDNTTAYCAVPRTLPRGAGIVRELANDLPDDFYSINLASGTKNFLANPDAPVNATNLVISDDGKNLFFTNTLSGALEKIQLK